MIISALHVLFMSAAVVASDQLHNAGYQSVSLLGEGPSDITKELEADYREREALIELQRRGQPNVWTKTKNRLNENVGLMFGMNWTLLYQKATDSLDTDDWAGGGRRQIAAAWTAIGRGTENEGTLGVRFQNRDRVGSGLLPTDLGPAIGSVWTTGFGFDEFSFVLTDLWWEQAALEGKIGVRFGKYLPFDVFDPFSFKSPLTGFQNAAFSGTPAMVLPSFSLGVSGRVRLSDELDLILGINDANGEPDTSGFDTFFDDREYFVAGELRWRPAMPSGAGKFHVTTWHTDEREQAQTQKGWGTTFSGEYRTGRLTPFLRYSWSDGGAADLRHLIACGLALNDVAGRDNDLAGIGLSWGKPDNSRLDNQTAAELFYRTQVLRFLALTPSVQTIINPAGNPDKDVVFVFGIRGRMAF